MYKGKTPMSVVCPLPHIHFRLAQQSAPKIASVNQAGQVRTSPSMTLFLSLGCIPGFGIKNITELSCVNLAVSFSLCIV